MMKTEIRFLIDLVLDFKLPAEAKKLCLERIGEVEASLGKQVAAPVFSRPQTSTQSPSTQALLDAQAAITGAPIPVIEPQPVITSAAAQLALSSRETAIKAAMNGKPEPGRTSPRKF
jgi:hypothetical protein